MTDKAAFPSIQTLATPVPLSQVSLPEELDGSRGRNRVPPEKRTTSVDTDLDALEEFLSQYEGTAHTLRLYRTELERFMMWCVYQRGIPVSSAYESDLVAYRTFLADPQPESFWCGRPCGGRPRNSPGWRPFGARGVWDKERQEILSAPKDPSKRGASRPQRRKQNYGLEPGSINVAFNVIGSFFSYLTRIGYLNRAPKIRRRDNGPLIRTHSHHALTSEEEEAMQDAVLSLPRDTYTRAFSYERARFLLTLMFNCGPRCDEILSSTMGNFERDFDGHWQWRVIGKGRRERIIPLNSATVHGLRRWRQFLGLPSDPVAGERVVLLPRRKGADGTGWTQPITSRMVNLILQNIGERAAVLLEERFPERPDRADKVRRISSHWGRHTALTKLAAAGTPPVTIMQTAGHRDMSTTLGYIATGDNARREALESIVLDWKNRD